MTDHTGSLTGRIREAVGAGDFFRARLLWADYGRQFRDQAAPISASQIAEARELAEWTKTLALSARAFARDRLARAAVARKYGCPERAQVSNLALRG